MSHLPRPQTRRLSPPRRRCRLWAACGWRRTTRKSRTLLCPQGTEFAWQGVCCCATSFSRRHQLQQVAGRGACRLCGRSRLCTYTKRRNSPLQHWAMGGADTTPFPLAFLSLFLAETASVPATPEKMMPVTSMDMSLLNCNGKRKVTHHFPRRQHRHLSP